MFNNKRLLFFSALLLGLIITLITPWAYAQDEVSQDTPFEKKYFKDKKKKKLKDALYNIRKGDAAVKYEKDHRKALSLYNRANHFNPNNASLNLKIAHCYQNLKKPDTSKIIFHFEKAYRLNPKAEKGNITYHLARIYHLNWHWDDAIKFYKKSLLEIQKNTQKNKTSEIKRHIQECENGKLTKKWIVDFDDLGHKLNSAYDEFAPVFSHENNIVYFTAQKKGSTGWHIDDLLFYEDIYYCKKQNDHWTRPRNLGIIINTSGHDALSSISADGKRILIYRGNKEGDIYESQLGKKTWIEAVKLPSPINTKYRETTACYSPDGKILYFVSNRLGETLGGLDIFMSKKDKSGKWQKPVNLDSNINTPYDEEGIYLLPSGKILYFSSKGHNSIGGYDIFKSEFINGKWTKAQHLPIPVNTPDDDVYIWVSPDEKQIAYGTHPFFAKNPKGNRDIYVLNLIGEDKTIPLNTKNKLIALNTAKSKERIILEDDTTTVNINLTDTLNLNDSIFSRVTDISVFTGDKEADTNNSSNTSNTNNNAIKPIVFEGVVLDSASRNPIPSIVIINDLITYQEKKYTTNSETGKFSFEVKSYNEYLIAVKSDGYMIYSGNLKFSEDKKNKIILLKKLREGSNIVLKNILFNYNNATLGPSSFEKLKYLIHQLEENPNLKIEISGHTDNVGSASFNQTLSVKRAKVVYLFLLEAGIEKERLSYKGYGFSQPISNNNNQKGKSKNRRTEFKVLEY